MKVLVVLLACSLAANAAYLIVRGSSSSRPAPTSALATASTPALTPEAEREALAALFDPTRTDAAALKVRLEAAGFPPEVARAAALAQVRHEYAERQRAAVGDVSPAPFWQTASGLFPQENLNPEQKRALTALQRERDARLRALAGNALDSELIDDVTTQQRWGPIPAEKIAAVRRIEGDYSELQREVVGDRWPLSLPAADREKLALLNRERRADLERVLTPEELFEYDLRQGPTAMRLRSQLAAFQPTEEEYRAIFTVQHALDRASGRDETYSGVIIMSSSDRDTDRAAQLEQMKAVLSPERFAEYEFATTSTNTMLVRITQRFGLSTATAREVASIRDATSEETTALRRDTSLAPAERDAQIAQLSRTAVERVSRALGPDAYSAYLENGGSWLTVSPRPASRPAPSAP